uniref:Uncharacterized protein n=1 Tax=Caenorhabditis japonica TaxID=281687 RepID=A0A8R1IS93_CAEJA
MRIHVKDGYVVESDAHLVVFADNILKSCTSKIEGTIGVLESVVNWHGKWAESEKRQEYKRHKRGGNEKTLSFFPRSHSIKMIHMPIHASSSIELHQSSVRRLRRLQNSSIVRTID